MEQERFKKMLDHVEKIDNELALSLAGEFALLKEQNKRYRKVIEEIRSNIYKLKVNNFEQAEDFIYRVKITTDFVLTEDD